MEVLSQSLVAPQSLWNLLRSRPPNALNSICLSLTNNWSTSSSRQPHDNKNALDTRSWAIHTQGLRHPAPTLVSGVRWSNGGCMYSSTSLPTRAIFSSIGYWCDVRDNVFGS